MAKYRKKPVEVEAEQFNPDVKSWLDGVGSVVMPHPALPPDAKYGMETLEGFYVVTPGDWIITGVKGEKYPCKPDIFEQTYEKVSD